MSFQIIQVYINFKQLHSSFEVYSFVEVWETNLVESQPEKIESVSKEFCILFSILLVWNTDIVICSHMKDNCTAFKENICSESWCDCKSGARFLHTDQINA